MDLGLRMKRASVMSKMLTYSILTLLQIQKRTFLMLGISLSLLAATPSHAPAEEEVIEIPREAPTLFSRCASEEVVNLYKKGWYWYESMGVCRGATCHTKEWRDGNGWRYGGSYVKSTERINKSDYGHGSGYIKITGYRLKGKDGTWINKLFIPLTSRDSVCPF